MLDGLWYSGWSGGAAPGGSLASRLNKLQVGGSATSQAVPDSPAENYPPAKRPVSSSGAGRQNSGSPWAPAANSRIRPATRSRPACSA